jgi:hypothetical protein
VLVGRWRSSLRWASVSAAKKPRTVMRNVRVVKRSRRFKVERSGGT